VFAALKNSRLLERIAAAWRCLLVL